MERWEDIEWPPLLPVLVPIALMFVTQFVPSNVPALFKDVAFALSATVLVIGLSWATWHVKGRWNTCITLIVWLGLSGTSAALTYYGWLQVYADVYAAPKPVGLPKLTMKLVPESIGGAQMNFHIAAMNRGPGDIDVIRYSVRSPSDFALDDHSPYGKRIIANDDLDLALPSSAVNRILSTRKLFLTVAYRVLTDGEIRNAEYKFAFPGPINGPIPAYGSEDHPGMGFFLSGEAFTQQQFMKSCAGISYGFHETFEGVPNVGRVAGGARAILVDSVNRTARFETLQNGRDRLFEGHFRVATEGQHEIWINWCDPRNYVLAKLDSVPMREVRSEPRKGVSVGQAVQRTPPDPQTATARSAAK